MSGTKSANSDDDDEIYNIASGFLTILKGVYGDKMFFDNFYRTFFQLSPESIRRFKDQDAQSRALNGLISTLISCETDKKKFKYKLMGIRRMHQDMQINPLEISKFLQAFKICLLIKDKTISSAFLEKSVSNVETYMTANCTLI